MSSLFFKFRSFNRTRQIHCQRRKPCYPGSNLVYLKTVTPVDRRRRVFCERAVSAWAFGNERAGQLEVLVTFTAGLSTFQVNFWLQHPTRKKERPENTSSSPSLPSCVLFENHLQNTEEKNVRNRQKLSTEKATFPCYFSPLLAFSPALFFWVSRTEGLVAGTLQVRRAPGDFPLNASQTNRGTRFPAQRLDGIGAFLRRSITAHSRAILPFFNASLK